MIDQPTTATPRRSAGVAMHDLKILTWGPVLCMTLLLLGALVAPGTAQAWAVPMAVIGVALGVPHGAVDHLVPLWWSQGSDRAPRRSGHLAVFVVAYAGAAALAFIALLLAPTPALVAFLALSAVHFGRGEVVASAERANRPAHRDSFEGSVVLAYGLVVVGLLVWARPATTDPFLRPLSPALADAVQQSRGVGLVLVAIVVVTGLAVLLVRGRHLEAAELALLTATFAVAPPLAAFGVYFGAWHAVRHTGRLLDLAREHDGRAGTTLLRWRSAAARLAKASAAPTVISLTAIVIVWAIRDVASLQAEVAVLLALTFPHAAVVHLWDRRRAAAT